MRLFLLDLPPVSSIFRLFRNMTPAEEVSYTEIYREERRGEERCRGEEKLGKRGDESVKIPEGSRKEGRREKEDM